MQATLVGPCEHAGIEEGESARVKLCVGLIGPGVPLAPARATVPLVSAPLISVMVRRRVRCFIPVTVPPWWCDGTHVVRASVEA